MRNILVLILVLLVTLVCGHAQDSEDTSGASAAIQALKTSPLSSPGPNCASLAQYRDTYLIKKFDAALDQYALNRADVTDQIGIGKKTLNLMNDQWWVGQTGAEIAIALKAETDVIKAWLAGLTPETKALDEMILKPLDKAVLTTSLIETEIHEGAKATQEKVEKEAVKEWISQKYGPIGDTVVAVIEYRENTEGLEKFKQETQYQVSRLVLNAKQAGERAKRSRAKAEYIEAIKEQIDQACGNKPLDCTSEIQNWMRKLIDDGRPVPLPSEMDQDPEFIRATPHCPHKRSSAEVIKDEPAAADTSVDDQKNKSESDFIGYYTCHYADDDSPATAFRINSDGPPEGLPGNTTSFSMQADSISWTLDGGQGGPIEFQGRLTPPHTIDGTITWGPRWPNRSGDLHCLKTGD